LAVGRVLELSFGTTGRVGHDKIQLNN
jgi:hypothetical protein